MLKINFGVNRLGPVPSKAVLEDSRDFKKDEQNQNLKLDWNRNERQCFGFLVNEELN